MPGPMPPQGGPQPQAAPPAQAQGGKPPIPPSQAMQMIHDGLQALGPAVKQAAPQLGPVPQLVGQMQAIFMQVAQELGKEVGGQGGPAPQPQGPKGPMPQNASGGSTPAPQY